MTLHASPELTLPAQHSAPGQPGQSPRVQSPELVLRAELGPKLQLQALPRQAGRAGSDAAVGVVGGLIAVVVIAGLTAGGIWLWRSLSSGPAFGLPFGLQQASRFIQAVNGDADASGVAPVGADNAGLASNSSPAAADTSVVLWNRSREVVSEIRLSSAQDDKWGDDLLGDKTLAPGQSFTLAPGNAAGCRYDVLVKYESGTKEERRNIDFCGVSEIVFDGR